MSSPNCASALHTLVKCNCILFEIEEHTQMKRHNLEFSETALHLPNVADLSSTRPYVLVNVLYENMHVVI